jgi:hypothetical protein
MKFYKFIMKTVHRLKIYKMWSYLYRFLFQRKYNQYKLETYYDLRALENVFKSLKWTKDSTKELFDSCGSAHWVQYCLNQIKNTGIQPEGALDCDDFSNYAISTLWQYKNAHPYKLSLVCVSYKKSPKFLKGLSGHMVCLIEITQELPNLEINKFYHISNWGLKGPFDSKEQAIKSIGSEYAYIMGVELTKNLDVIKFYD